jgi:hypothetical protein
MKTTLVPIALLALVRVTAPAAGAADEARFHPPESWTVARQADGTVAVQAPGVRAGKTCAVLIMPDVEGEVNAVFATGWKLLTEPLKVVSGGEPRAGRSMAEYEMRSTTAVVDAADTGRAYMYVFAVQVGPRVRRALFISDDKAAFDEHLPTVKAMLDSVGVDPATAKQRRAAAKGQPTGFEGVFYRGAVEFNAAGGRGELGPRVDYLCLAPDGRAYNGRPSGGPAACFEAEDPRSPSYGRYTLRGDDVVVRWHFDRFLNQQHTQKLRRRADGKLEQEGGAVFHRLPPCDGLKLDGTYARTWGDGSKSSIRFTRDGRFTEQGMKSCVADDDLVYPDWPKLPERGSGTYSIGRNTLEVKYDNGGPSRRMFFVTPDDPADPKAVSRISVGNNPLQKQP